MAKLAPGIKLLRSLARAARSQRKMATSLLAAAVPQPPKRSRKPPSARPAVAPPPLAGRWLMGQHALPSRPGLYLHYWLYLPSAMPDRVGEHGWPLVVMLHGCQQDATQFADGTRMNRLAEAKGYAVLYPQQSASVQAQRCWRWYERAAQQGGGDTALLVDVIGAVCRQHAIDRRRVYACGLSAGAGMAALLALNHPELFAAVGLHSAPMFGGCHDRLGALRVMRHGAPLQADAAIDGVLARHSPARPMPPMPAILIQGQDDRIVHPFNQRQLARQWLLLNGMPDQPAARSVVKPAGRGGRSNAHEIHDYVMGRRTLLRVASIGGLGHAWSGGDPSLRFNVAAGPDASRMMLAFFGKHRR